MHTLKITVDIAWVAFWIGWLAAALAAKQSTHPSRGFPARGIALIAVLIVARVLRHGTGAVHSATLITIGAAVFACGIAFAVWARVYLGRNWGMPMTERAEPELVTSGPYRFVRHPIYSGLLLALVGTALVNNLLGLIVVAAVGAYFYYATTVEERNMTAAFPTQYPAYRSSTKRLIPFVL